MSFRLWLENSNEIVLQSKVGKVRLVEVASGFITPTCLVNDKKRVYVSDQIGKIFILEESGLVDEPFLDISDIINKLPPNREGSPRGLNPGYDERGLLGFAFHPDYQKNGRLFVFHSQKIEDEEFNKELFNHESVLVEYRVSKNPDKVLKSSRKVLLRIPQEEYTHNGGTIRFGPDGYLYIAVGDGGCCGDNHGEIGNAQDLASLKGKILRIDVDRGNPYSIPDDNPFVGKENIRPEIYAYGLRNPWGMSFDLGYTNKLYVGQVGEGPLEKGTGWECIFIIKKGGNYGWRIREGSHWFDRDLMKKLNLEVSDFENPLHEYNHDIGISVIGGFVYRGKAIPGLFGKYVFGDWSAKWSERTEGSLFYLDGEKRHIFKYPGGSKTLENLVLAFGEGADRELYVLVKRGVNLKKKEGKIFKLVPYLY